MKKIINFSFFTCLIVWIILLFAANQSIADTYCVANEANLIAALNNAEDNGADDVIKIQQGTYYGNFVYASTESFGVRIEGGYTALCAGRDIDPANTVLDAQDSGIVLNLSAPDVSADFMVNGITLINGIGRQLDAVTLGRVTLTNNIISGVEENSPKGGGVYIANSSTINLTNNIISNNRYEGHGGDGPGGGISIRDSGSITLINNNISRNEGGGGPTEHGGGGGIYIDNSGTVTMINNTISNNFSDGIRGEFVGGGGVYIENSSTINLINNNIRGNRVSGCCSPLKGGGVYIRNSSTINLTNNTISNNSSEGSSDGGGLGGGILLESIPDNAIVNIYNNIIWNNIAQTCYRSGCYHELGNDLVIWNRTNGVPSTVNLYNNDFDQSADGTYISIPFPIDPSNLNNEDPLFVDPTNGDFHLTVNSPCIDAGASIIATGETPDGFHWAEAAPGFDIDGDSRPRDNGYDIGADEYPGPEYWTDDRMRDAVPPPMGVVVTMSEENELQEYVNQGFAPESEFMLITD